MRTPTTPNERSSDRFEPEPATPVISVSPENSQPVSPDGNHVSTHEVAVVSTGLLLLISIWYFVRRDLGRRKASEGSDHHGEGGLTRAESLTNHLPCTKCHYFKANMYLPCAVNPTAVLKPEAMNCSDFMSRNGTEYTEATG